MKWCHQMSWSQLLGFFVCLFDLFENFNWRLISLQYCGGFCHKFIQISHGCTYVPNPPPPTPPSSSHPSESSQGNSPEHFVSCTKPGLAFYFTYDNVHVSRLFSQIIPPTPSPTGSKSVLYICVSSAVSHIGSSSKFHIYGILNSIYMS